MNLGKIGYDIMWGLGEAGKGVWALLTHPIAIVALLAIIAGLATELHRKPPPQAWVTADTVRVLSDSGKALLAAANDRADSYRSLYDAAEKLNHGKLVAAIAIEVAKQTAHIVHDTLVTQMRDSSRWASFNDSTFAGTINGVVTAPRFPGALQIDYTITQPAFEPKIGFVRNGTQYTAVVVWRGQNFTPVAPFFTAPPPPRPKLFGWWAEGLYNVGSGQASLRGGPMLRLPWGGISAVVGVRQTLKLGDSPALQVGVRKEW